jgi:hypothetical protein
MSQTPVAINTGNIDPSFTDCFDVVSLERELCRVVQHQHRTGCCPNSIVGRLEMTSEYLRFADPIVIKKPVRRLSIRPVLTDQRDAIARPRRQLREQRSETLTEPLVFELTVGKFPLDPCAR